MLVRDIIKGCGGPTKVAEALRATRSPITRDAVFRWYHNGIPEEHWPVVIRLGGYSLEQIYSANRLLEAQGPRGNKKRGRPRSRKRSRAEPRVAA